MIFCSVDRVRTLAISKTTDLTNDLSNLGKEGWEMVNAACLSDNSAEFMWFKRPAS